MKQRKKTNITCKLTNLYAFPSYCTGVTVKGIAHVPQRQIVAEVHVKSAAHTVDCMICDKYTGAEVSAASSIL